MKGLIYPCIISPICLSKSVPFALTLNRVSIEYAIFRSEKSARPKDLEKFIPGNGMPVLAIHTNVSSVGHSWIVTLSEIFLK
jgi:hypothetical protein